VVCPGRHRRPADTLRQRRQEVPSDHHQHADSVSEPHSDSDTYSHTNSHTITDADSHGDTNGDTNGNSNTDANGDTNGNSNTDANANANANTYRYANTDADSHGDTDGDPNANSHGNTNWDTDGNSNTDRYTITDADPHGDTNGDADGNSNTDRYTITDADPNADPFGITDTFSYREPDDRNPHLNAHSHTDANSYPYGHANSYPYGHADTNPYGHANSDTYGHANSDTQPFADPAGGRRDGDAGHHHNCQSYADFIAKPDVLAGTDANHDTRLRPADDVADTFFNRARREPSAQHRWPTRRRVAQLGVDRAGGLPPGLRLRLMEALPPLAVDARVLLTPAYTRASIGHGSPRCVCSACFRLS
jgi:hypothetical protein